MIRDAVIAAIKAGVPAFQDRVFEPHAVPWDTPDPTNFPYAIVIVGPESKVGTWEDRTTSADVLIYADQSTYQVIDTLTDQTIAALDNKRLVGSNGEQAILDHQGAPLGDQIDTRWRALYRPVRFAIYPLGWLSSTFGTLPLDPVAALAAWTTANFPSVSSDPATWTPDDATPAVYWRVDRIQEAAPLSRGVWWTLVVRGHVLVPDVRLRNDWIMRIIARLAFQHHVVMADGSWLTFQPNAFEGDVEADPFRQGQIVARARMFTAESCDVVAGPIDNVFATQKGVTTRL